MAANRHNPGDLQQMQSLPLQAKIIMTQRRIRDWYDHWDGQVYVSFSGGKDSTVLKHLVETTPGVHDVPCVFVDTGLEYPEVRKFATERADVVLRPEMRFDEVIKTYGYPVISKEVSDTVDGAKRNLPYALKKINGLDKNGEECTYKARYKKYKYLVDSPFNVSKKCCDIMKKKPAKSYEKQTKRHPIVGTMACESFLRQTQWTKRGCNAFDGKRPVSAPMSFWTENDVLEYIQLHDLDYASVYGDIVKTEKGLKTTGCDRTGCMFCMFGITTDGEPNRFQRMKETHPRQYDYCMRPVEEKGLGLREVLEYIGVPYE